MELGNLYICHPALNLHSYPAQTLPLDITMTGRQPSALRARKIESLKAHQEYLRLLGNHHQEWIDNTDDPEVCRLHLDILDLIKQMEDRNRNLLDALRNAPR